MAYAFNGTSQYLYGNSAPVTGAPLTIACWFQRASTGANSICVSLGQTATGATNLYNLLLPPTGGIAFLSNASGSTSGNSNRKSRFINSRKQKLARFQSGRNAKEAPSP